MGVTFVDSRDAFLGNEWRYIGSDGIHPTAAGSRALADLILNALN
jgi:lysophospholipase L1-like esterase